MQVHHVFVPARTPEPAQSELNALLASLRLLAVHRQWLADGAQSGWAYCLEVQPGAGPLPEALKAGASAERRRGADIEDWPLGGCRRTLPGWHRQGAGR